MLVLGVETSCDETGVALFDSVRGLLAHSIYSQVAMHAQYGGVVPEIASRDHIRRVLPLTRKLLADAGRTLGDLNAIAFTQGPGLAGALLTGASIASALGFALKVPVVGVHHMEGHLLSPLLCPPAPEFPYVALLVSGGHSQLMRVAQLGDYVLLGETLDDAAGEAFDKTAKLLGLGYPGGPAISALASVGKVGRYKLPRPMLHSGNLDFSFSGLKTAVLTLVGNKALDDAERADIAAAFQEAIVEVLVTKSIAALEKTGFTTLVVAGGVGANQQLRDQLSKAAAKHGYSVFYPKLEFCTDNGAMIALAGAMRLTKALTRPEGGGFSVRPRWRLENI